MTLITRSRGRNRSFGAFTPSSLFLGGIQGAWYDPSDMTTLFQDAAGTTPVTAVEQPVGRVLDKSGRGNHATQSTAASRPVLRARYNLLTYSEDFGNAAWTQSWLNVTTNSTTAPDGTVSADTLTSTSNAHLPQCYKIGLSIVNGSSYVATCYIKAGTSPFAIMNLYDVSGGNVRVWFNMSTGTVATQNAGATGAIQSVGGGWYRCSITRNVSSNSGAVSIEMSETDGGTLSVVGRTLFAWGAQLLTAADATATGNAYQRVGASTDYATGGVFRPYLAFDGVDDRLQTASVNIASDAVSLFAGHSIQTAGGWGTLVSSGVAGSGGIFLMLSDTNGAAAYQNVRSDGTLASQVNSSTFAYPYLDVWTMQAQISTDTLIARRNGAQTATSSSDQGTGTYASNVMYVGSYTGGGWHYPGRIYGLIVRGAASSAVEVAQTESWLNAKTGAY